MALVSLAPYILPTLPQASRLYALQFTHTFSTTPTQDKAAASDVAAAAFRRFSKKLVLRSLNRTLIARLARRATIGIPCLGLFLAVRIFKHDVLSVLDPTHDTKTRSIMAVAATADAVDIAAQSIIVAGILQNIAPAMMPAMLLSMHPALALAGADQVSLTCALISCTAATVAALKSDKIH